MEQTMLKITMDEENYVMIDKEYEPFYSGVESLIANMINEEDYILASDKFIHGIGIDKELKLRGISSIGTVRYNMDTEKVVLCEDALLRYFDKIPDIIYLKIIKYGTSNSENSI